MTPTDLPSVETAIVAAGIVKTVIGVLRMGYKPKSWVTATTALILGPLAVLGMVVAKELLLTPAVCAQVLLAGVLASGFAMGVHEIGDRAKK